MVCFGWVGMNHKEKICFEVRVSNSQEKGYVKILEFDVIFIGVVGTNKNQSFEDLAISTIRPYKNSFANADEGKLRL